MWLKLTVNACQDERFDYYKKVLIAARQEHMCVELHYTHNHPRPVAAAPIKRDVSDETVFSEGDSTALDLNSPKFDLQQSVLSSDEAQLFWFSTGELNHYKYVQRSLLIVFVIKMVSENNKTDQHKKILLDNYVIN